MIDLSTRYLGLTLASPLVASASPLSESVAAIFVDRVDDSATLLVPRGPIEEAVVVH
jgi:hypothetical protein